MVASSNFRRFILISAALALAMCAAPAAAHPDVPSNRYAALANAPSYPFESIEERDYEMEMLERDNDDDEDCEDDDDENLRKVNLKAAKTDSGKKSHKSSHKHKHTSTTAASAPATTAGLDSVNQVVPAATGYSGGVSSANDLSGTTTVPNSASFSTPSMAVGLSIAAALTGSFFL